MTIIGVDLAGKITNPSGICMLTHDKIELKTVYSDQQILDVIVLFSPDIIAIDAPIIKGEPRVRSVDRTLKKYGAFPPSLPSMKSLTLRGLKLAAQLKPRYTVIEIFPTATAKILGIYNKNYKETAQNLDVSVKNKHELDAYLCSLTGKMFLEGTTVEVGDEDGIIIIPKPNKNREVKKRKDK